MVKGLLLDRVDTEPAGAPVGGENQPVPVPRADEAAAALPVAQPAAVGAQVALQAPVTEPVPEPGRERHRGPSQDGGPFLHQGGARPGERRGPEVIVRPWPFVPQASGGSHTDAVMLDHMDAEVPHPAHPSEPIGVLTLNLWGTNGPVRERLDALIRYLEATKPAVVALQEVRFLDGRSQSELIAEACGYPAQHYDRSWGSGDEEEGLAVLSRHPLTASPSVPLPGKDKDVPRQLQRVEVEVHGRPLLLANTHLAFRRRHGGLRLRQVRRIVETLPSGTDAGDGALDRGDEAATRPVVLVGDLNAAPWSRAVRRLQASAPRGAGLRDAQAATAGRPRATFSLANPYANQYWLLGRRVDHVLVGPGLRVLDAQRVLTGADAPVVSDHYGVRVDLVVPAAAR